MHGTEAIRWAELTALIVLMTCEWILIRYNSLHWTAAVAVSSVVALVTGMITRALAPELARMIRQRRHHRTG